MQVIWVLKNAMIANTVRDGFNTHPNSRISIFIQGTHGITGEYSDIANGVYITVELPSYSIDYSNQYLPHKIEKNREIP
jgi:hypothetical protein